MLLVCCPRPALLCNEDCLCPALRKKRISASSLAGRAGGSLMGEKCDKRGRIRGNYGSHKSDQKQKRRSTIRAEYSPIPMPKANQILTRWDGTNKDEAAVKAEIEVIDPWASQYGAAESAGASPRDQMQDSAAAAVQQVIL